jgi:hypothetical protein
LGESSSTHRGILAFVDFHVRHGFFERMLLAYDRDSRPVFSWLDASMQCSFPFSFVGSSVLGGESAVYHGMFARRDDLIVATHVDDNDHEFPVI